MKRFILSAATSLLLASFNAGDVVFISTEMATAPALKDASNRDVAAERINLFIKIENLKI